MKENLRKSSKELYKTLCYQNSLLEKIYEKQKIVRNSVVKKDWETLQKTIDIITPMSQEFNDLETTRVSISLKITDNADDIYNLVKKVPTDMKIPLITSFQTMKRALLASKIENNAISEYVRVTQDFMQKVFDEVLPQRRTKVYSSKGEVIKHIPTSVILDTIV